MSAISTYLAPLILDHVFNGVALPTFTGLEWSLHTADPGKTGTSEVVGGSYARQALSVGAPFQDASNSDIMTVANDATVVFTDMPGVTVTWVGVWDGSGNFLWRIPQDSPLVVIVGEALSFTAGQLKLTLD